MSFMCSISHNPHYALQMGKLRHRVFLFGFSSFLTDRVEKLEFNPRYLGSRAYRFSHCAIPPSVSLKVDLSGFAIEENYCISKIV